MEKAIFSLGAKPEPGMWRRLGKSALRTLGVFVIISATGFLSSVGLRPPALDPARNSFTEIVADAHTFEAATEEMADVAPPVWLRETSMRAHS